MERCQQCKFVAEITAGENLDNPFFECRYNPPTVLLDAVGPPFSRFPTVQPGDYCGKFENKKE